MRSVALKKEIEAVVAAWPAIPALELPKIANDNEHNPVLTFDRYAQATTRDIAKWQEQALTLISKLEQLFQEADEDGNGDHIRALISTVNPILESIEKTIEKLVPSLEPNAEAYIWLSLLENLGNKTLTEAGKKLERQYRELVLARLRMHQECKERLMRIIWDHDPDARGGPKFDNSDDLIAFLEN